MRRIVVHHCLACGAISLTVICAACKAKLLDKEKEAAK